MTEKFEDEIERLRRHNATHSDAEGRPLRLSQEDIEWIHEQRKQSAHEAWLRGQVKVIWPWVVSVLTALVAAVVWIKDHVKL